MKKFLVVSTVLAIAGIGIYELYPHLKPFFEPSPVPPTKNPNNTPPNISHPNTTTPTNPTTSNNFQQG